MAAEPQDYLAVLKAAYDYDPQPDADDEIAVKENQLLYLLERVDDEYVLRITPHPPRPPLKLTLYQLVEGQDQG